MIARHEHSRMNPQLALVALQQGGAFTGKQAGANGLSRQERRTLVKRGVLRELRRDVFTSGEYWDGSDEQERHRIEIAGALLARSCMPGGISEPALAAGHASAGFLHGLPLPWRPQPGERLWSPDNEPLPWERRPRQINLISASRSRRQASNVGA